MTCSTPLPRSLWALELTAPPEEVTAAGALPLLIAALRGLPALELFVLTETEDLEPPLLPPLLKAAPP